MKPATPFPQSVLDSRWLLPMAVGGALGVGWLVGQLGALVPGVLLGGTLGVFLVLLVFSSPRAGLVIFIGYCFGVMTLNRHLGDGQFGLGMEALLGLTWLAVVFHRSPEFSWALVRNDLCGLALLWFIINVLELANPAGASPVGWLYEMRGTTLYWVLTVPLACLVFGQRRDLRLFLKLIIGLSVLGTLYGIKQKVLGVDEMEQHWLDLGAGRTHLLWGQLRVFSVYSEAAQFGTSQAHVGLICLILALGPFARWQRLLLAGAAGLLLYGMLISGTRGALFLLVVGGAIYLLLSKQLKVLLLGALLGVGAFGVLKYTTLGNSNLNIQRLRTGLDPEDASLQIRLQNQRVLREYLATRPLGGGVGVSGMWGTTYNADKFLSSIPPDSYFVKVWVEYGIVGLLIWLTIMLYLLGKCGGIVWQIRDPRLRQQLLALTAGYGGILASSYGNEIMNQMPTAMILFLSWVFVFNGPRLDTPPLALNEQPEQPGQAAHSANSTYPSYV